MKLNREIRFSVEPADTTKVVRFRDFQDEERICTVKDYSRSGVSFVLEDGSLLFKIGDIISGLHFYSLDQEVHTGNATIVHIQDFSENSNVLSVVGCTYNDELMDIYSIVKVDKITRLQNDFFDFMRSMAVEENLDPDFVQLTTQLHFVLSGFQEKLTREEERIRTEEGEDLRPALLDTLHKLAFTALDEELTRYYARTAEITRRFTDDKQHYIHREFFQKRLGSYLMQSALYWRANAKPLGYAGDFEMMNIIYRNEFEGDTAFARVINKIDCEGPASKAVRNRRGYLKNKLGSCLQEKQKGDTAKIISVACGPTLEIYDILQSIEGQALPCNVEFIGMDQDTLALENARTRIGHIASRRDDMEVHFLEDNIKRLIVGKTSNNDRYEGADCIYTAGLFDYLSERAANRLIHKLFSFLRPGGILVIGNFGDYNPQRFIMEYGAEWFLIHRSREELIALAHGLPEATGLWVEQEPEGVNLFLNIRKPE